MKRINLLLPFLWVVINAYPQTSWVRVNQVGYLEDDVKIAVWISKENRTVNEFNVVDTVTGEVVFSGTRQDIRDMGKQPAFESSARLNFSAFKTPGTYVVKVGETESVPFRIANDVYAGAADIPLQYMRQQRCGYNPFLKDSCHVHDAISVGDPNGKRDGLYFNTTGGWHDASDYLQYVATSANAVYQMLFAYSQHPQSFGDKFDANGLEGANGIPDVLDEAKWGLDWLVKMNPDPDTYFNQLADDRDHVGFTLPNEQKVDYGWGPGKERPVYFVSPKPQGLFKYKNRSTGMASTLGKYASSFALGAKLLSAYYPDFANILAQKAKDAYQNGVENPGVSQTAPGGAPYFYEEDNWVDDMQLAAMEMYHATGQKEYLTQAIHYGRMEPVTPWMGADSARHYQWYPFVNLGHYHLAVQKGDQRAQTEFIHNMKSGLQRVKERAKGDAFLNGIPFIWCSNNLTVAFITQCRLYHDITGDDSFLEMETSMRDWLLGCNPWGTSMIVGYPAYGDSPSDPHSAFTHLHQIPVTGGIVDGPIYNSIFSSLIGIYLANDDEYADFQSDRVVYHDDYADYSTNEPTMDGTASLTYYLGYLSGKGQEKKPEGQLQGKQPMQTERKPEGQKQEKLQKVLDGIVRGDTSKKQLSLVFTGHEYADGATTIQEVLKNNTIKGTFFLTGDFYRKYPTIVRDLQNDGHYMGPHSDKHLLYADWQKRDSTLVSRSLFEKDLNDNYRAMEKIGLKIESLRYFMPPYEWYNQEISNWAKKMDVQIVNFTPGTTSNADYTTPDMKNYLSSETIYDNILKFEEKNGLNGFILLIHIGTDPKRTDKLYNRLNDLVKELKNRKYQFVRIDELCDTLKPKLGSSLSNIYKEIMLRPGRVTVDSIARDERKKRIELYTNLSLSYLPMRENSVLQIYDSIRYHLPASQKNFDIHVFSDGQEISELIPNYFRSNRKDKERIIAHKVKNPLVTNISAPSSNFDKGLQNNHIAMWQSHGWYYEQKLGRWEWQRARIFETVEDLYTQSYVVPFLVPMLENAGANVLLPRERDYNKTELIIDNDETYGSTVFSGNSNKVVQTDNPVRSSNSIKSGNPQYRETNGKERWLNTDSAGFANPKMVYLDGENPFRMGTARQIKTITRGDESFAEWRPVIPEKGKYGVYVSYQTVKNSSDDALYSVYHAGGKTDFKVNQQMGGGTWIFLGYFDFDEGSNSKVTLSNKSNRAGKIITADAVKIGGGMGNMARMPFPEGYEAENTKSSDTQTDKKTVIPTINYKPETSGYPRYTEGARYWMQWAGVPDSVYNRTEGKNDYTDDYASRGVWVNWLAGGSTVRPKENGLNIPIDLSFAFHTDAGTFWGDTIVGTLGIYMTHFNDEQFENGKSRWASRDLSELVMEEIVKDIRREFEPDWTRRHLWNRSYAEARIPNVPTMLLELLSHQNFADMRYGLDPSFRFTVSRSIYKGMLRFLATQYNRPYVVQPLPVKEFSTRFVSDTEVELQWQPTPDPAEPSATPTRYIVYTRLNGSGFDNGVAVDGNRYTTSIQKDSIYSYKVVAMNDGGLSFPSEILSVCRKTGQKGETMIVNGFTRISAPLSFTTSEDSIAGFASKKDYGVPYIADHHFIGHQHEFRRVIPWMDDDASGFGDSDANYETTPIAGNTFDYPYIHGQAFANAGFSFVSSSAAAIGNKSVSLQPYQVVDWILGKQREWSVARGAKPTRFKTFPKAEQEIITEYCNNGGNIIVSGAFVGTDLWDNPSATKEDREWAQNTLKYKWRNKYGAVTGQIKAVPSPFPSIKGNYSYYHTLNSESYAVEFPDAIEPANEKAFTVFRYSENNLSAGILYKGENQGSAVLGFPIESVKSAEERTRLVEGILQALGI